MRIIPVLGFAICALVTQGVHAAVIEGKGEYHGSPTEQGRFDRGMQATQYCGNDPESWVRASVSLDKDTGMLTETIQLETDSTAAGPKGKATSVVKDAKGAQLAVVTTDEAGRGGKSPGLAAIQNFGSTAQIDPAKAKQAASIAVSVACTGKIDRFFNINLGDAINAIKSVVAP